MRVRAANWLCAAIILVGCSGDGYKSPTAPYSSSPPTQSEQPADPSWWIGDSIFLTFSGAGDCSQAGSRHGRSGVYWDVKLSGAEIALNEDMRNWPTDNTDYTGTVAGRRFVATHRGATDGPLCSVREGRLEGEFSRDGNSFQARETLIFRSPTSEGRLERSWRVARR
jgi:hypothetical protein